MDWPLPGGPATPPLKRSKRTLNAVTGEDKDSPSGSYDPDDSPQNTAQVRFARPPDLTRALTLVFVYV